MLNSTIGYNLSTMIFEYIFSKLSLRFKFLLCLNILDIFIKTFVLQLVKLNQIYAKKIDIQSWCCLDFQYSKTNVLVSLAQCSRHVIDFSLDGVFSHF